MEITATEIRGSDWRFNNDTRPGRVLCHGRGDIVRGKNMDWDRVYGEDYLRQKLIIYFAIPPGEVINDPEVGCSLHKFIFMPLTPDNLVLIRVVMEYELKNQLPELGTQFVEVLAAEDKNSIKLTIYGYNTWIFNISRENLIDINLLDVFSGV